MYHINITNIPEILADKGFSMIPVKGDKTPIGAWKVRQSEPHTVAEVKDLIDNGQSHFALVCGVNDLECIDIDTKNVIDGSGKEFYDRLADKIPFDLWSKLVVQDTPSGGKHFLYRTSSVGRNERLALNGNGKPIIETRGVGGYVLVEPSPGYTIVEGELVNIQAITDEERTQLFELCRSFTSRKDDKNISNASFSNEIDILVDICLTKIEEQKLDLTSDYDSWIRIGFAFANQFGEEGRAKFHRVSQFHPEYDVTICDRKYCNLLETTEASPKDRRITIATFFAKAKEEGIDMSSQNDSKIIQKYKLVLGYLNGLELQYNEFTRKTEIYGGSDIEDRHVNSIYADLQEMGVGAGIEYIGRLIHSNRTLSYHPVKDFLDRAKNNTYTDEIDRLFGSLELVEADPDNIILLKLLLGKWLLQIPGVIYDELPPRLVLVLIGPSHIGKTHFFRNLLPEDLRPYYAESSLNAGKDSFILMSEKLLINNDEFGGIMRMNEMEQFKRMASAEWFDERRAYGKYNEKFRRRAILCGTSNRSEVIMDHTAGNTRIIPIEISNIDRGLFNGIDKTKLLANILALYQKRGKGCSNLSFKESDSLQEYSRGFQTVNFEQEAVLSLFQPGDRFYTSGQIAENVKREFAGNHINAKKLSQELRILGFSPARRRVNGRNLRGWLVSPVPRSKIDLS